MVRPSNWHCIGGSGVGVGSGARGGSMVGGTVARQSGAWVRVVSAGVAGRGAIVGAGRAAAVGGGGAGAGGAVGRPGVGVGSTRQATGVTPRSAVGVLAATSSVTGAAFGPHAEISAAHSAKVAQSERRMPGLACNLLRLGSSRQAMLSTAKVGPLSSGLLRRAEVLGLVAHDARVGILQHLQGSAVTIRLRWRATVRWACRPTA